MKTLTRYLLLIAVALCTLTTHAQSTAIEQEYLQKLAESFVTDTIHNSTDRFTWSKSLGSDYELSAKEMQQRINALTSNGSDRIAFYKRLNYYLNYTHYSNLVLIPYHIEEITAKHKKQPKKQLTAEPLFSLKALEEYASYIRSFGIDQELSSPCLADSNSVYTYVNEPAVFPGGDAALINFLVKQVHYPQFELDAGIEGRVMLRLVICENGKITDIQALSNASSGLMAEAKRVAKLLPQFIPAKKDGKAVSVYYTLPIVFKLQ